MYREARRLNKITYNIAYNNSSYVKESRPIAVRSYYMSRFSTETDLTYELFIFNSISVNFKVENVVRMRIT